MDGLTRGDGAPRENAAAAQTGSDHRLIFVLRVVGIVVALSPILATLLKPILPSAAGQFIYVLFSPVCHNRPTRTLEWFHEWMPLCSRCFGIFIGFGTAGVFPKPRWGIGTCLWVGFVASVLMVADVVMQDLGMHPIWHSTRILTGVVWGHICGLGILAVGRWLVRARD